MDDINNYFIYLVAIVAIVALFVIVSTVGFGTSFSSGNSVGLAMAHVPTQLTADAGLKSWHKACCFVAQDSNGVTYQTGDFVLSSSSDCGVGAIPCSVFF